MKKAIILIILIALAAVVGYRAYNAYKAKAVGTEAATGKGAGKGGDPRGAGMMRVPLVDVAVAEEGSLEDKVMLVGSLRPIAEVQVMSKIAGRLERILADVGDAVSNGQLLAQVEDREIEQQIQQAEASLGVSRATIQQREAELANYRRQVARLRELFEQNLISRQDLEDAATRQQTAEAQLELSRAQYRQSDANLNQYKINLENTRSYAVMDGFVSRRFLHPGALITMNTPILNVVDLRTLRMVVNLVEKDIVRVGRGAAAEVSVDAFPGKVFPGRVLRVSPVLDPATRTGEVEIHVANPRLDLRAEMFARVILDLGGGRSGLLIPREAMVFRGEQGGVFVLEGAAAKFRPIRVGATRQKVVEVVEGLKPGEQVVTMGASLLKDGDRVRLKGEEPAKKKSRP